MYGEGDAEWEGSVEDKQIQIDLQQQFYENDFKRYLEEGSKRADDFLSKFVAACTGSSYLPFVTSYDKNPFRIQIEFNFTQEPFCYPKCHTVSFIVLVLMLLRLAAGLILASIFSVQTKWCFLDFYTATTTIFFVNEWTMLSSMPTTHMK